MAVTFHCEWFIITVFQWLRCGYIEWPCELASCLRYRYLQSQLQTEWVLTYANSLSETDGNNFS